MWHAGPSRLGIVGIVVALTACGGVIPAADAGAPPFPECEADAYAFVGETSLAALGLTDMWPDQAGRVGEIWVTAGPPEDPAAFPMPPGQPPVDQRIICLEFDDGSGMSGPIDDGWQPPGGIDLAAAGGDGDTGAPLALLAVVVAALVVAGVSVLAFRGSREPGA